MLGFFLNIMKQDCGNFVTVQLLQTLNILFENIRHETSLYYLLSNNHVNSITQHKFDLSDEEVMAYYISYLKTLSFKLNPHTIHFFFNGTEFPLYSEAVKYFNHPEKMVRIAVRILTLNVFKVEEKSMLKYITGQNSPCLIDLVHFIRDNVINIEKCLKDSSSSADDKQLLKLDDLFAEHLDHLHFLNDILTLKVNDINRILADNLVHHLVKPLVDAYKDDPKNSMIRLFTLEFITSILSKVLAVSMYEEIPDDVEENSSHEVVINKTNEEDRNRLGNDVKDCDDKQEYGNEKLSGLQMAIIEQSKEIAELKVKTLLKADKRQQMTYLGLFDNEFNEMKKKRMSIDYLLIDAPANSSSSSKQSLNKNIKTIDSLDHNSSQNQENQVSQANQPLQQLKHQAPDINLQSQSPQWVKTDKARYMIRDFLLWRQLLLNIRNEKDIEFSLKNTSWISYAKLLQWLE